MKLPKVLEEIIPKKALERVLLKKERAIVMLTKLIEASGHTNVDVELNALTFGALADLVHDVLVEAAREKVALGLERLGKLVHIDEAAAVRVGEQKRLVLLVQIIEQIVELVERDLLVGIRVVL